MSTTRQKSIVAEQRRPASVPPRAAEAGGRADNGKSREEEFLRAALDLFAERNFASVTIKDIAEALNVNTALIYYYFENKTDLFGATIEFAVENAFANMRAIEEASDDPAELLAAWLQNHVDKYAEIHSFVKIALDHKGSHDGDARIEASIAKFYARERELLTKMVRRGMDQRVFNTIDSGRMAQFISTYLDGCMVRSVILPDFNLKAAVGDLQKLVLDKLGYKSKKGPRRRKL